MGLALSSSVRREEARAAQLQADLLSARSELANTSVEAREAHDRVVTLHEERQRFIAFGVAGVLALAAVGGVAVLRLRTRLAQQLHQAVERSAQAAKAVHLAEARARDLKKFGHQKMATAMLGTADDLRRALDHISEDALRTNNEVAALHSGIEMVSEGFERRLGEFDITRVSPLGEQFDPHFHEAVQRVDDPAIPFNTVTEVLQDGYVLSGRCIRPAMVVVNTSSAIPKPEAATVGSTHGGNDSKDARVLGEEAAAGEGRS